MNQILIILIELIDLTIRQLQIDLTQFLLHPHHKFIPVPSHLSAPDHPFIHNNHSEKLNNYSICLQQLKQLWHLPAISSVLLKIYH